LLNRLLLKESLYLALNKNRTSRTKNLKIMIADIKIIKGEIVIFKVDSFKIEIIIKMVTTII
jgi:hypothetical protein